MAIYRYSPESIDSLSHKTRRHQAAGFVIIIAGMCAATIALSELRAALTFDIIFVVAMAVIFVRGQRKALQRIGDMLRSTEIEIDDEKAASRSKLSNMVFYRSEILEACLSTRGIWLFRKSRRRYLHFPPEIENFDNLLTFTEQWLPQGILRRNAPPSTSWAYLKVYGIWTSAGLLLYVAIGNQTPAIAIPACILASAGVAWYFGWCGRKTDEKKWKVLLPLSGYFFAAALLGRAFKLWTSN